MKQFVFKISYFILIPLGTLLILDLFISDKLKDSSHRPWENEVWNDIYDSNVNADMAIYGSSKAWAHFNPNILENAFNITCYNFGLDGSSFWWQYLRHKEYFQFNSNPNLIILSVDINTFKKKNSISFTNFLPYMLWNINIYWTLKLHNKMNNGVDFLIPLMRYMEINKLRGEKNLINRLNAINEEETYSQAFNKTFKVLESGKFRYKGYRGFNLEWTNDFEKAKEKFSDYRIEIDTSLINLLENFISEVRRKNIDLIFVYSPEYIKGQNFVKNRNEIILIYKRLSKKHNIPFFDYSNSSISYNKDLFYNTQHLNKKGSTIFTKQLIYDLQNCRHTTDYIRNAGGTLPNNQVTSINN